MRGALLAVGAAAVIAAAIALYVLVHRAPDEVVANVRPPEPARDRAPAPTPTASTTRDDAAPAVAVAKPTFVPSNDTAERAAAASRLEIQTAMQASGSATESWADQGMTLLRSISPGRTVDVGCYVAGCVATLTFRSEAELQHRQSELEDNEKYRAWTGGKKWSLPHIHADGSVLITLAIYRPD